MALFWHLAVWNKDWAQSMLKTRKAMRVTPPDVNFSFHSVRFVQMKVQFSSIPYSPTIEHGDRSVRLVGFDQKVHELFQSAPDFSPYVWEGGGRPPLFRHIMVVENKTLESPSRMTAKLFRSFLFMSKLWHSGTKMTFSLAFRECRTSVRKQNNYLRNLSMLERIKKTSSN